jgi:hypothetical protein
VIGPRLCKARRRVSSLAYERPVPAQFRTNAHKASILPASKPVPFMLSAPSAMSGLALTLVLSPIDQTFATFL